MNSGSLSDAEAPTAKKTKTDPFADLRDYPSAGEQQESPFS